VKDTRWIGEHRHTLQRLAMVVVVVAVMGLDCDDEGPLENGLPVVGEIFGRVTTDGLPRAAVTIAIRQGADLVATRATGAQGTYEILDLPPGVYEVSISTITGFNCPGQQTATVVADGETEVNFACLTPGSVTGFVTVNGIGAPVLVTLRDGTTVIAVTTSSFAGFEFTGLDPGERIVEITPQTGWTCETTHPVTITSGGTATVDFPCIGQVIGGEVTVNGVGEQGVEVSVCLEPGGSCLSPRVVTDLDGLFDYTNATPGDYVVSIGTPPTGATCEAETIHVPASATVVVQIACTRP